MSDPVVSDDSESDTDSSSTASSETLCTESSSSEASSAHTSDEEFIDDSLTSEASFAHMQSCAPSHRLYKWGGDCSDEEDPNDPDFTPRPAKRAGAGKRSR